MCKLDLMKAFADEPGTSLTIRYFFVEFLGKLCLYIRVLICFSLYYVHESLLTCAIIYTCLDLLPVAIIVLYMWHLIGMLEGSLFICFPVLFFKSFILDPSRLLFIIDEKNMEENIEKTFTHEELKDIVFLNSIIRFWYSLIGLIFSSIFITLDFSCNESCDQFYSKINRFHSFFVFCLVIDAMTIMYSIVIFCCSASGNNIPFVSAYKFKDVTGGITDEEGQRETEGKEEKEDQEEKGETEVKEEKGETKGKEEKVETEGKEEKGETEGKEEKGETEGKEEKGETEEKKKKEKQK